MEIFAYIHALDYNDFLEIQEDVLMKLMDVVLESGSGFAFPSSTIYFREDAYGEPDRRDRAEAVVRAARDKGTLDLPRFSEARIAALNGEGEYPPSGSSARASSSS